MKMTQLKPRDSRLAAIALLLLGSWSTRHSILKPLKALSHSAERIGAGDLDTAVQVQGLEEVKVLAATLESTRAQLKSTQQELLAWANQLEQRVDQRTRELNALYDVNREISSRLDTQHVLPFAKPAEVREQVLRRCEIFAPGGGFVFNTIHNVQACTPIENIVAMLDAVHEFNGRK